jgi:hypothetical protein
MPRKYLMSPTFKGRHARWRKLYKGVPYTVNCSDLGLPEDQWTELGSYQAANQWWIAKKAEIDGRKGRKAVPPEVGAILTRLRQKVDYCQREGLGAEATVYAAALADAESQIAEGDYDLADVDPLALARSKLAALNGVPAPSDPDPTTLNVQFGADALWADRLRRDQQVVLSKRVGTNLDNWYQLVFRRAKPSSVVNIQGYYREFKDLRSGTVVVLHEGMDVEVITEAKFEEVFKAIDAQDTENGTKKKKWAYFKQFVTYLSERRLIPLPNNFRSKHLVFKVPTTGKLAPDVQAVRTFLDALPDRLKVYALLALNCGMNNVDIGKLRHTQIDWKKRTLTRRRVKTEDSPNVPTVTYRLWPETARLLRAEMNPDSEYVLTTEDGEPLYLDSKGEDDAYLYDRIKSRWRDHFKRGKKKPYTLKQFRFFGADLLKSSRAFRQDRDPFLGHAPRSTGDKAYSSAEEDVTHACEYLEGLFYPKPAQAKTSPSAARPGGHRRAKH